MVEVLKRSKILLNTQNNRMKFKRLFFIYCFYKILFNDEYLSSQAR